MRKRVHMILSVILILCLSILVGCGSRQNTGDTPTNQPLATETPGVSESPAPSETSTPTPEPSEEPEPSETSTPTPEPSEEAEPSETSTPTPEPSVEPEPSETPTPEPENTRDSSYVLTGDGTVECVVEYDSSVVTYEVYEVGPWHDKYEFTGSTVPIFQSAEGAIGYPVIRSGCASYEDYKNRIREKVAAKSVPEDALWFSEFESCTVNGYTYYAIEFGYMTETDIDDQTRIYVQLTDNEYLEVCSAEWYTTLEELANTALYIAQVRK